MPKLAKKTNAAAKATNTATIANPDVVKQFKAAAKAANAAMEAVIAAVKPDATIFDLCKLGDDKITEALKQDPAYEKVAKGIAFPTCVSPNHIVAHFSPLSGDAYATMALKEGDMVKIQLGAQVDGEAAIVAHTMICGEGAKVEGRAADVLLGAHYAAEAALRLMQPGNLNTEVSSTVQKVAEEFGTIPMQGMLSTQMTQNNVDAGKAIILNPTNDQRANHKSAVFAENEVYQVDIIISTGEGKTKDADYRTTVYKKTDSTYMPKLKTSTQFLYDVKKHHPSFPFTLRALGDDRKARLGVLECAKNGALLAYQVYAEKPTELVAQFQFTVLLLPTGPERITGTWFDPSTVSSDKSIQRQELKDLLKA
ncbi:hypothetical protein IWQ60_008307 [Tieghemiomyces parasiticus]|uniref:Peptidase M24 domain-containing protein n=1 Tax=Tieghemiomyces parasiticus TaxID=78921 RepID=A0A9W7ZSR9_9FUNG|nr:hypothetical protein IWQ60_008307 [Tieghemiomyces parasiticus]